MKNLFFTLFAFFSPLWLAAQSSDCFSLYMGATNAQPGDTVCLEVTADGLAGLLSMQLSMRWDPSGLRFDRIDDIQIPGLSSDLFNISPAAVDNGFLTMSWFDFALVGITLPDGSPLFSVCFEVLNDADLQEEVRFAGSPTPIEFVRVPSEVLSTFSLIHGGVYSGGGTAPAITGACALAGDCQAGQSIDITVSGGQPTYSYAWMKGEQLIASTEDLSGNIGGSYELTVTDEGGATASGLFVLTPDGLPYVLGANVVDATCSLASDGAISLQLSGPTSGLTFDWNNGATGYFISGLSPGPYTVTISNASNGCSISESFTVGMAGSFQSSYSFECTGDNNNYTADITCTIPNGSAPPYTFAWSTGQVDNSPTASTLSGAQSPGAFNVTITDANGCQQVADSFYLDCGATVDFISSYAYDCTLYPDGSTLGALSLGIWSGGTPPYHFEWSTGLVEVDTFVSVAQGLADGLYTVTVTDANGLVYYPEPLVLDCGGSVSDFLVGFSYECEIFTDTAIATVSAVVWSGGTPPYTFEWSTGEVNVDTLLSQIVVPGQGIYSLTITDSEGTQYVPDPVEVDCYANPGPPSLSIGEGSAPAGGAICIPVTAENFSNLDSLQLAISWDPAGLQFVSVQPGLIAQGFNYSFTGNGNLLLDWNSGGQSLAINDASVLFSLCFNLLGNPGQSVPLFFNDSQAPLKAYSDSGQEITGIQIQNGAVLIEDATGDGLQLSVGSAVVETGDAVCVPITVQQFVDMIGAQFSVRWNADSLHFDSLSLGALPNLGPVNFNLTTTDDGYLSFQWLDATLAGVTLPDGAALFSLCFTAGDQAGSSPVSVSSVPTLIEFTNLGLEVAPVSLINGLVTILQPDVWPGDTDADEDVDHYDLLNIGLAYGAVGPARPDATTIWEAQVAPGWQLSTPASGIDYKHIDTDGNGLVDAADTLAIVQNWGLTANFANPGPPPTRAPNNLLYVQPDTVALGQDAVFDIMLGEAGHPAEEVYGLAFTIVYDTAAVEPGTTFASFGNSWMGQLYTNLLGLNRDRYEDGRIDVALTRIDGENISGYGPIAQLHITIQDVIFMRSADYEMFFQIENVRLINKMEDFLPVQSPQTIALVEDAVSSTAKLEVADGVEVFPVPAREVVYLRSPESPIQAAELLSLDGRSLARFQQPKEIPLAGLPDGAYLLRVWTERGLSVHRVVVAGW